MTYHLTIGYCYFGYAGLPELETATYFGWRIGIHGIRGTL